MKLQECKNYLQLRWHILKVIIYDNFQNYLANRARLLDSLISTVGYTITFIFFVNVLFNKVNFFAGYSKDQFLFFTLIGQINFFLYWNLTYESTDRLNENIQSGGLDLVLSKPMPGMFYTSLNTFNPIRLIREALVPMAILCISINWNSLKFNIINIIIGTIIFILGQTILNCIHHVVSYLNFWNIKGIFASVFYSFIESLGSSIPLEGLNKYLQLIFLVFIPVMIYVGLSTSVFLNFTDPMLGLILTIIVTIISMLLKHIIWNRGIKQYSSASS